VKAAFLHPGPERVNEVDVYGEWSAIYQHDAHARAIRKRRHGRMRAPMGGNRTRSSPLRGQAIGPARERVERGPAQFLEIASATSRKKKGRLPKRHERHSRAARSATGSLSVSSGERSTGAPSRSERRFSRPTISSRDRCFVVSNSAIRSTSDVAGAAGERTVQAQMDNAGGLKLQLVLTQFCDHILPVHTCKCVILFHHRQETDANSMA